MANDFINAGRALGQGLSMGWSDEAEAQARALKSGRTYEEELADVRNEYARFAKEYPIAQPALEFVGGALPAVAAMVLPGGQVGAPVAAARTVGALGRLGAALRATPGIRNLYSGAARVGRTAGDIVGLGKTVGQRTWGQNVGRATGIGAVEGGIGGAGSAEDGRMMGALVGTGLGAGLGGALTIAPGALGAAGRYIGQYAGATADDIKRAAARRLTRSLGMDPVEMRSRLELDRAMGVPSLPMNVSPGASRVAETLAARPDDASLMIGRGIAGQREGLRERLANQVRLNLAPTSYYAQREQMANSLRKRARGAYEKAYDFGAVDDPKILEYLDDPSFREAFAKGRELSEMEARQAQREGRDPARYRMTNVYRSTGQIDPERIATLKAMGISDDTIEKYLMDLGPSAMTTERVALPNVQTLDYIKRGLDAMIRTGQASADDLTRQKARLLRDARIDFVNRIDEVVPDYKAARQEYAGDMEVIDALDEGFNNFQNLDPEELTQVWKGLGTAERDAYRTGVARNLWGQVMNPSGDLNYAKRIFNSPATQQKLRQIFPSQAQFDLFAKALTREMELFSDVTKIVGGSPTARRTAGMAAFENEPLMNAATALATQGFQGGLTSMVVNAFSRNAISDDVAKQMAEWLTANDPQKVAAVVQALERFAAEQAPKATRRFGVSAGLTGGTTGAMFPAPEERED